MSETTVPPRRGRAVTATVLLVLAVALAPVAATASWVKADVLRTEGWVAAVGPIASDPVVQQAITDRATEGIVQAADLSGITETGLAAVAERLTPARAATLVTGLQDVVVEALTERVRTGVERVVTSDRFAETWVAMNTVAHRQVVATLRGEPDALAAIGDEGTLVVQVGPVLDLSLPGLVEGGIPVVSTVAGTLSTATVPILSSAALPRLAGTYHVLELAGTWLPWVALGLLVAGVAVAVRRGRAVAAAGAGLAVVGGLTLAGIAIGRAVSLDAAAGTVRPEVAGRVIDALTADLRVALLLVAVAGAVAMMGAVGVGRWRAVRGNAGRGTPEPAGEPVAPAPAPAD